MPDERRVRRLGGGRPHSVVGSWAGAGARSLYSSGFVDTDDIHQSSQISAHGLGEGFHIHTNRRGDVLVDTGCLSGAGVTRHRRSGAMALRRRNGLERFALYLAWNPHGTRKLTKTIDGPGARE